MYPNMEILRSRKVCPYCKEETFGLYKRIVLYFTSAKPCTNCKRLVELRTPYYLSIRILAIPIFLLVINLELHPDFLYLTLLIIPLQMVILKPANYDIYSSVPCISCKKCDTLYYMKGDKVCINCTDKYAKIFK
jgi:hypothetical protein